jgi:hypothetical protein
VRLSFFVVVLRHLVEVVYVLLTNDVHSTVKCASSKPLSHHFSSHYLIILQHHMRLYSQGCGGGAQIKNQAEDAGDAADGSGRYVVPAEHTSYIGAVLDVCS